MEESNLLDTLKDADALSLIGDIGEVAIDNFLEDGPLKDIPILGTILKLYQAGIGINGYLFTKKLLSFLSNVKNIPEEERNSFFERINKDPQFKKKIGDHLLLIIERMDDIQKPLLLTRAFYAYIKQDINYETFQRLTTTIDRVFLPDLEKLSKITNATFFSLNSTFSLASCGIIQIVAIPTVRGEGAENKYEITEFGKYFTEIVITNKYGI